MSLSVWRKRFFGLEGYTCVFWRSVAIVGLRRLLTSDRVSSKPKFNVSVNGQRQTF